MSSGDKRRHIVRFVVGPLAILAVFLFLEQTQPFVNVWKPLLLYYALAVPGFFLIDKLKARMASQTDISR